MARIRSQPSATLENTKQDLEGTELRLPTRQMARDARDRLQVATQDMQPAVHWQISQQMGRIVDY